MNDSELLKVAYYIGFHQAFDEAGFNIDDIEDHDMEKQSAVFSRVAKRVVKKKPGLWSFLFGNPKKMDPAWRRAREAVLRKGDATATSTYGKFRSRGAPLRYATQIT